MVIDITIITIIIVLIGIIGIVITLFCNNIQERSNVKTTTNITTGTNNNDESNIPRLDLAQLNKVSNIGELLPLPARKLNDLKPLQEYYISNLMRIRMKYAERIVAEIEGKYIIFLPARISEAFNGDVELFDGMVNAAHQGQLILIYRGGKYDSIEFKKKKAEDD